MFSGTSANKQGWVRKPKRAGGRRRTSHVIGIKHPNPDNDLPWLHPEVYEGRYLARLLRRNAKTPIWDKLSLNQTEYVQKGLPHQIPPPLRTSEKEKVLSEFFEMWISILDVLFFFRTVGKRIQIRFESDPEAADYHGFWGNEGRVYNIVFNHGRDENKHLKGWENLFSKIIHEMLHTFLKIYTCRCPRCLDKGFTQETATSHNSVWANSMIAIQDALNRDLGWQIDCKIPYSIKLEMSKSDWIPKKEQLDRWGVQGVAGLEDVAAPENYEVVEMGEDDEERNLLGKDGKEKRRHCNIM